MTPPSVRRKTRTQSDENNLKRSLFILSIYIISFLKYSIGSRIVCNSADPRPHIVDLFAKYPVAYRIYASFF